MVNTKETGNRGKIACIYYLLEKINLRSGFRGRQKFQSAVGLVDRCVLIPNVFDCLQENLKTVKRV